MSVADYHSYPPAGDSYCRNLNIVYDVRETKAFVFLWFRSRPKEQNTADPRKVGRAWETEV